jgi:Ca2+-binding EF-hand superfamily protein
LKQKGDAALSKGDYAAALEAYIAAIEQKESPMNEVYCSRSATYLKLGNKEEALKDAQSSLSLHVDWKGYYYLGAAQYALGKHQESLEATMQGCMHCRENDQTVPHALKESLRAARWTLRVKLPGMEAARKVQAAVQESNSTLLRPRQLVQNQIRQWQAQESFLKELEPLSLDQKVELLYCLLDAEGDDVVQADELAQLLRNFDGTPEDFIASLETAIVAILLTDQNQDGVLNRQEFGDLMQSLSSDLREISTDDFVEMSLLKVVTSIPLQSTEMGDLYIETRESQIADLFRLFDKDGSGQLSFREVAVGLYQITQDVQGAARQTTELLLALDKEDTRTLNQEQFGRLILGVVASSGASLDNVMAQLKEALLNNVTISEEDWTQLVMADAVYEAATDLGEELRKEDAKVDALCLKRLNKLFDLYDANADGVITFQEMVDGLRSFQTASDGRDDAIETAIALFGFDDNSDMQLDRREFGTALAAYAKLADVELHDLIDFMCVTHFLQDDATQEYRQSFQHSRDTPGRTSSMQSSGEFSLPLEEEEETK